MRKQPRRIRTDWRTPQLSSRTFRGCRIFLHSQASIRRPLDMNVPAPTRVLTRCSPVRSDDEIALVAYPVLTRIKPGTTLRNRCPLLMSAIGGKQDTALRSEVSELRAEAKAALSMRGRRGLPKWKPPPSVPRCSRWDLRVRLTADAAPVFVPALRRLQQSTTQTTECHSSLSSVPTTANPAVAQCPHSPALCN